MSTLPTTVNFDAIKDRFRPIQKRRWPLSLLPSRKPPSSVAQAFLEAYYTNPRYIPRIDKDAVGNALLYSNRDFAKHQTPEDENAGVHVAFHFAEAILAADREGNIPEGVRLLGAALSWVSGQPEPPRPSVRYRY